MVAVEGLSFSYAREGLFTKLGLSLEPGMIYGLLGKNGAGKTTLLKLISGQLFPGEGRVEVFGYSAPKRSPDMLKDIFFLPEEFSVPSISGSRYAALNAPFYPGFNPSRFAELCHEFEVDPQKRLIEASLGQKKKFLICFGLSTGARLIILDEPTNGLDIPSKRQFRRLVASSLADNQSILISTHQVRDMENLIDPIIILDSGRILFNGDTASMGMHFHMSLERGEPASGDLLYSEKVPGGYSVVRLNHSGTESDIDIEVFFNMVVKLGDKIERLMYQGMDSVREGAAE